MTEHRFTCLCEGTWSETAKHGVLEEQIGFASCAWPGSLPKI